MVEVKQKLVCDWMALEGLGWMDLALPESDSGCVLGGQRK
jgi:hypothetical protein